MTTEENRANISDWTKEYLSNFIVLLHIAKTNLRHNIYEGNLVRFTRRTWNANTTRVLEIIIQAIRMF